MGTEVDEKKETETPATSSVEEKTKQPDPKTSDGGGDTPKEKDAPEKEHMIPKHRFDEVAEKARLGERAMEELSELRRTFAQLGGGKAAAREVEDEAKALADKYGLQDDFVRDMLSVSTARAKRELEGVIKPLQANQAQAALDVEMRQLEREYPEASEMSKEERAEFLKMAVDQRYQRVPLADLWKIKNFGRPAGKAKTAESGRGGGARTTDEEPDIKGMSLEEFEKFSNEQAKKRK